MCPFCIATVGLVATGTVSTGGVAALAVKISRKKSAANQPNANLDKGTEER